VKIKHANFACGWLPMWQHNKIEKKRKIIVRFLKIINYGGKHDKVDIGRSLHILKNK
jgi:hypothetical protein